MKKSLKTFVSIVCIFTTLMSTHIPVLASSTSLKSNIDINKTDRGLLKMMKDMNLTDEEASYLMELEHNRRKEFDLGKLELNQVSDLYQTSSIGVVRSSSTYATHSTSFKIHWSTATITVFGIAGLLVGKGVGLGAALVLANAIVNEAKERGKSKGVIVTVTYYVNLNNNNRSTSATFKRFY